MTGLLALLRDRFTVIWLVLAGATVTSSYLGADHGVGSQATTTTLLVIVAAAKVRLVGLYFMELREAPAVLRGLFEAYCALVCAMILGIYHLP